MFGFLARYRPTVLPSVGRVVRFSAYHLRCCTTLNNNSIVGVNEIFPLVCPICAGQMHLIAFITEGAEIRKILDHIGVDSQPPHLFPARGPPLWDNGDAQIGEGVEIAPDWDLAAQPAPDYEVDQRVNW
jgi:hypothetical protein